jgi:type IV pilus assembly protein PilW
MRRAQGGFGLLELMLALTMGLLLLAAASQLFSTVHQTWRLQGAAARMQDDARLALLRMAQDIRMAGMFGCLRLKPGEFDDPVARQAFAQPVEVGVTSLSLVVAQLPGYPEADWTLLTDCSDKARVHKDSPQNPDSLMAIPISRHRYELNGSRLMFSRRGHRRQPLIDHVREMRVTHVRAAEGERVDLQLTLHNPSVRLEQRYDLSVALRNPVASP